jgi:hypothetical protein
MNPTYKRMKAFVSMFLVFSVLMLPLSAPVGAAQPNSLNGTITAPTFNAAAERVGRFSGNLTITNFIEQPVRSWR